MQIKILEVKNKVRICPGRFGSMVRASVHEPKVLVHFPVKGIYLSCRFPAHPRLM